MVKKKLSLALIPTVILVMFFLSLLFTNAQTITIDGIKAHDVFNYDHEPSNYEEVAYTLNNRPSGRTGYSGILYMCSRGQWVQDGPEVNTDDSGRDKRYPISEYETEVKRVLEGQYGEERVEELYQAALDSGASLVFDASRGKEVIYSSGNSGTKLPCTDGERGYFYNNLDFWLTLSFTVEDETIPKPDPDPGEEPDPEPKPEPNIPPVPIIKAPNEVEVGDKLCIRSDSYDPDGKIVFYDWSFSEEPQSDRDDYEGFTEESDGECSVYFEDEGEVEVWLQVTDDGGSSRDTTYTIKVTPPKPKASFQVEGHFKENRELKFTATSSGSSYSPINWVKSYVEITAVDPENNQHIRLYLDEIGGHIGEGKFFDTKDFELLFKKTGEYKIDHYVENTLGYSDTASGIFFIEEDLPPVADFETTTVTYRNPNNKHNGIAYTKETIYQHAFSPDGDYISDYIYEIRWDSDNDGDYSDEETKMEFTNQNMQVGETYEFDHPMINGYKIYGTFDNHYNLILETPAVGKYLADLTVWEGWYDVHEVKTFD